MKVITISNTNELPEVPLFAYHAYTPDQAAEEYRLRFRHEPETCYVYNGRCCYIVPTPGDLAMKKEGRPS